jgi:filamentous hemagglutinin family protein
MLNSSLKRNLATAPFPAKLGPFMGASDTITEFGSSAQRASLVRNVVVAGMLALAPSLMANPEGMTVNRGTATATTTGSQLDLTVSRDAFLTWSSFNIGSGESTIFHQPSASSIVWNRITDSNPSQIWGHLSANGIVVLMNQSGFYFGPGSVVNAAGFVATTATTLPQFDLGGNWQFNGPPPAASIVNYGEIRANSGGSIYMIAEKIENHGVLMAPDGTLGLYAGKNVLMSERPDGRGLSVQVSLPEGSIDNSGRMVADAGSIMLNAQTVNQTGTIQANSVRSKNGVIELVASESITLGADSVIEANGDSSSRSTGGKITIKSSDTFSDESGSRISVTGGGLGGNGGQVEISAPIMSAINSEVDGHAVSGSTGGNLLIDPTDIVIGNSGTGAVGSGGEVHANDPPTTLRLNVNSAFTGLSHITLQASRNITLNANTTWDLNASTGISSAGSQLTLEAGNNITIQSGASIRGGHGWSISLDAGSASTPSTGSILVQGINSGIETQDGSISLRANKDITLANSFVRTMGGGSINAIAETGSVNTGTRVNGFQFLGSSSTAVTSYMRVDPDLGGISTGAGGDVSITAGQDITSYLPSGTQALAEDAGSGAFGGRPGNVTLHAGGDITGHYVVRNGTGTISAGDDAGNRNRQLALSLISGGWSVTAGEDIMLQEVRNPNGIFNNYLHYGNSGHNDAVSQHYFDYSSSAYVNLMAGNSVQLLGGSVPRRGGTFEQSIPSIYAPTLNIIAGAGGVDIADDVILYPSSSGQLTITTTGGGSLTGTKPGGIVNLIMSDSSATTFTTAANFGADDHASSPIHLNDSHPVTLSISGDMTDVMLVSPKRAVISIGGDMTDSRFSIQNLHSSDTTSLIVGGNIENRNEFTTVTVSSEPDFSVFDYAYPSLSSDLSTLPGRFYYDASTHQLTFRGRMTSAQLAALTSLSVQETTSNGTLLYDSNGNPITHNVSILSASVAQTLFNNSQDVPDNPDSGYTIAGPGTLSISAHNMDLGATLGIRSVGPLYNHALATLGSSGAAINVNLTGNLDMFSTAISSIAGGGIYINTDGYINLGSSIFTGDQSARGIYTVAKADVYVIAGGDIDINGSRIAAYDGGNVTVISRNGNVDAGSGGQGSVEVTEVYVNSSGEVLTYTPTIPGSGILATTFPNSLDPSFPNSRNVVGNILVETPHGSIYANAGGVIQSALNDVDSSSATVTLIAGTRDSHGNVLYRGDIDASGSGVIGNSVDLDATGNITGVIVASGLNSKIVADQNINVTAISSGSLTVSAGGTVSGTIVGVGGVTASGSSIDAEMLSQNTVSANNANVGSSQTFVAANAAGSTSQATAASDQETRKMASGETKAVDDDNKKRAPVTPGLMRRVGRVTVILPKA